MNPRRLQILDAAATLFNEKGFAQTSVDEVIHAASLSGKSHFYHYFKSKEELGLEVIGRQFELMAEKGAAILREPSIDALERLNLFIDSVVALQVESGSKCGSPFGMLGAEMAERDEGFRLRIALSFREWIEQIQSLLESVRDQLTDDAEPRRLARFIVATLEGATQIARMKRDVSVIHGIALDLKRFIASQHRRKVVG